MSRDSYRIEITSPAGTVAAQWEVKPDDGDMIAQMPLTTEAMLQPIYDQMGREDDTEVPGGFRFNRTVGSTRYTLYITRKELLKILANDGEQHLDDYLFSLLNKLPGVVDTDYDGHFGPHIFVTIEHEFDTEENWKVIEQTIADYIAMDVPPAVAE